MYLLPQGITRFPDRKHKKREQPYFPDCNFIWYQTAGGTALKPFIFYLPISLGGPFPGVEQTFYRKDLQNILTALRSALLKRLDAIRAPFSLVVHRFSSRQILASEKCLVEIIFILSPFQKGFYLREISFLRQLVNAVRSSLFVEISLPWSLTSQGEICNRPATCGEEET